MKTVCPGRYLPDVLLKLKQSEKVTFSHCVPTILQMLLQAADASKQDLSGWKMIIGGSALSPALCKAARAKGIDVFAGYGMSETGPVVALAQMPAGVTPADENDDVRRRSLTGRPVPLVDFRVVDTEMRDVPRDGKSQGEIVLRAPFLTQGYFKKPQASEELWAGGYLHTQDVAVVSPDGSIQIVDRIKDVIKTGGEWVSSIEVESLIVEVPGVQECAVIGVKDEKWGERPMAFVVCKPDAGLKPEAVRAHLQRHVECEPHQQVRRAGARPHRVRARDPQDERRQDQQEGAARAQRLRHLRSSPARTAPRATLRLSGREIRALARSVRIRLRDRGSRLRVGPPARKN